MAGNRIHLDSPPSDVDSTASITEGMSRRSVIKTAGVTADAGHAPPEAQ